MTESIKAKFFRNTGWFNILNLLIFAVLFFFSFHYYLERTIAFDSSFYAFKIIQFLQLNIENDRFVAAYPQFIPLLGLKLHCSLKTFLILYSLSYTLFNFASYLIIDKVFRQKKIAIAFVLSLCFAYRYNYFYIASEIHQIFMYLFLFAAVISFSRKIELKSGLSIMMNLLSLVIVYLVLNVHILSVIPIIFIGSYFVLEKPTRNSIIIALIQFVAAIVVYKMIVAKIPEGSYQAKKMLALDDILDFTRNYQNYGSYNYFITVIETHYKLPVLVAGLTLILLLIKKKFLQSLLFIGSVTGFLLLILTSYKLDSPIVYQNYYSIFGIFILLPFIDLLLDFKIPDLSKAIIVGILAVYSLLEINNCSILFRNRLNYYDRLTNYSNKINSKKLLVSKVNIPWGCMWVDWAMPFETILYSSVNEKSKSFTAFAVENMNEVDSLLNDPNLFLGPPWSKTFVYEDQLNPDFFELSRTLYYKINSNDSLAVQNNKISANSKLKVEVVKEKYSFKAGLVNYVDLRILNEENYKLPTKPKEFENFFITYKIYTGNRESIVQENRRRFDADILPYNYTDFSVEIDPLDKGNYYMDVFVAWKYDEIFFKLENVPITIK